MVYAQYREPGLRHTHTQTPHTTTSRCVCVCVCVCVQVSCYGEASLWTRWFTSVSTIGMTLPTVARCQSTTALPNTTSSSSPPHSPLRCLKVCSHHSCWNINHQTTHPSSWVCIRPEASWLQELCDSVFWRWRSSRRRCSCSYELCRHSQVSRHLLLVGDCVCVCVCVCVNHVGIVCVCVVETMAMLFRLLWRRTMEEMVWLPELSGMEWRVTVSMEMMCWQCTMSPRKPESWL